MKSVRVDNGFVFSQAIAGRSQTYFCYTCGNRIAGYDHFRDGGCSLFTLQDIQVRDRVAVCGSNGSVLNHATAQMNHTLAHQAAFTSAFNRGLP